MGQMGRQGPYKSRLNWFDSNIGHWITLYKSVALSSVERESYPNFSRLAQLVERSLDVREIMGSSPIVTTAGVISSLMLRR